MAPQDRILIKFLSFFWFGCVGSRFRDPVMGYSIFQVFSPSYQLELRIAWVKGAQYATLKFSTKSKACNKTYPGLISMLQDSKYVLHEILANRTQEGRTSQHCRFCPLLANQPELAVIASTALQCPICQDYMQYIFRVLKAC